MLHVSKLMDFIINMIELRTGCIGQAYER
jgi:hypothetical protein